MLDYPGTRAKPGDILKIAQHNPIVRFAVEQWKVGVFSWEDMLAYCVIALAKHQEELYKQLVDQAHRDTGLRFEFQKEIQHIEGMPAEPDIPGTPVT